MGEEVNHVYLTFPCCDKHLREQHKGTTSFYWLMVSNQHGREDVGIRAPHVMVARKQRERMGVDLGKRRGGRVPSEQAVFPIIQQDTDKAKTPGFKNSYQHYLQFLFLHT